MEGNNYFSTVSMQKYRVATRLPVHDKADTLKSTDNLPTVDITREASIHAVTRTSSTLA